jgi:hypothetical protein
LVTKFIDRGVIAISIFKGDTAKIVYPSTLKGSLFQRAAVIFEHNNVTFEHNNVIDL